MKVDIIEQDIEFSGQFHSSAMKIKASKEAYRILSDVLYSDKIGSIIRELSSNAYDSHVKAGKADVPFDVKVPSRFDSTFAIRDYGVGLSRHDIETIYSTYFESTKQDSNDFVGCLGLGSKTPFCYTDMFSIVSNYNGMKYTYSAVYDKQNGPSVIFICESKTEECNGVTVQFAVMDKDFNEFYRKINQNYDFYPVKPNLIGPQFDDRTIQYCTLNKDYGILESKYYSSPRRENLAIMGGVPYSISRDLFDNLYDYIHLFFDIGELSVSASRENLSYDEKTKLAISEKIKLLKKNEMANFDSLLESQKTYWDCCQVAFAQAKKCSLYNQFVNQQLISWKGLRVLNTINLKPFFGELDIPIVNSYYMNRHRIRCMSDCNTLIVEEKTLFLINDNPKYKNQRIKKALENMNKIYLIEECSQEQIGIFENEIGVGEIKLLSSIEIPTIVRAKRTRSVDDSYFDKIKQLKGIRLYPIKDFNFDDGGIYFPMVRDDVGAKDFSLSLIWNLLGEIPSIKDKPIYGVKNIKIKKFMNSPKWQNGLDLIHKEMDSILSDDEERKNIALKLIHIDMTNWAYSLYQNFSKIEEVNCDKIKKLMNIFKQNKTDIVKNKLKSYPSRMYVGKIYQEIENLNEEFYSLNKEIHLKYPLLNRLNGTVQFNELKDYINMVNKGEEK